MQNKKIVFIGGGNMAASLIGGLLSYGISPDQLWVTDIDENKLTLLTERFQIKTSTDTQAAMAHADAVILAVKPQHFKDATFDIAAAANDSQAVIISIAAGIRVQDIQRWLGGDVAIVRAMPNTPALVRSGATALYANECTSEEQRNLSESILRGVGMTCWIEQEALMDVVTALSGSGPAYFFLLMELLEKTAIQMGLPEDTARLLTVQTAFGASKLALESDTSVASLRENVTSPGGTTEAALAKLLGGGMETLLQEALMAASKRSEELANEFGAE